ncbi:MAG: TlpA disulfide reductase family protein [Armatimonadota bacterium]|nr:TlpA disulfide reductase family protein [Armatimonadota bacterium]
MLRRKRVLLLVAVAAAAALTSAVVAELSPGTKAPDFTLPTLDGGKFTLSTCFSKAPKKVVLLDIWATWCPPCRSEIPFLIKLRDKFKKNEVVVVGVSIDRGKEEVVKFVKEQKINYTVAHDPNAKTVGEPYKVSAIPATYIIDKKGVIRHADVGFPRDEQQGKQKAAEMERQIKALLKEK